jgi:hypothetical protein
LPEQEEDNTGAAEGKRESGARGERFEERGKNWCCNKSMSSECCENDSDLRMNAGIQPDTGLGWVKGRRDTPCGRVRGSSWVRSRLAREQRSCGGIRVVGIADVT